MYSRNLILVRREGYRPSVTLVEWADGDNYRGVGSIPTPDHQFNGWKHYEKVR